LTVKTLGYLTIAFVAVFVFFRYLMGYVLPFALGIFLAFILDPLVAAMAKKTRLGRGRSALIIVLLLVTVLLSLITWAVTRIVEELTALYGYLPQYYAEFNRIATELLRIAGDISSQLPEPLAKAFQEQWARLDVLLSRVLSGASGLVRGVPMFLVMLLFTILSAYFVMKDRAKIGSFIRSVVPPRTFKSFKHVELDILGGVAGFLRAQAVLVLLTMIINVLGLTLVESRYAVGLGILLAIMDILPVVGPGLVYIPWILYQAIRGSPAVAVGLSVLYGAVSLLRQVAQTHLVGREMGLHPLATLASLYIGFRVFGTVGLIYGPLSAILIKGLWVSGVIPHEDGVKD